MDVEDKFDHLEILVALGLMPQSVLEAINAPDRVFIPCQDDEDEDEE